MKKYLYMIILSVIIGFFMGKFYVNLYDDNEKQVFFEGNKVYFIELGIKDKKDENSLYVYELESDGYHVYAGITNSLEIAEKIKDYYMKDENNTIVTTKYILSDEFNSLLSQYDKVLEIAKDEDIIKIEKIILSNYKVMVLKQ